MNLHYSSIEELEKIVEDQNAKIAKLSAEIEALKAAPAEWSKHRQLQVGKFERLIKEIGMLNQSTNFIERIQGVIKIADELNNEPGEEFGIKESFLRFVIRQSMNCASPKYQAADFSPPRS